MFELGQTTTVINNNSQTNSVNDDSRMDEDRKPNEYQVALKKGKSKMAGSML